MANMNEKVTKLLGRIKATADGQEFIEYLQTLSDDNYKAFKGCPTDMNNIHKGYAIAVDNLLTCFEKCDKVVEKKNEEKIEDTTESPWS